MAFYCGIDFAQGTLAHCPWCMWEGILADLPKLTADNIVICPVPGCTHVLHQGKCKQVRLHDTEIQAREAKKFDVPPSSLPPPSSQAVVGHVVMTEIDGLDKLVKITRVDQHHRFIQVVVLPENYIHRESTEFPIKPGGFLYSETP